MSGDGGDCQHEHAESADEADQRGTDSGTR